MICQGPDCSDDATRGHLCLAHYRQLQRAKQLGRAATLRPKRLPHGALEPDGTVQINVNLSQEVIDKLTKMGPTLQDAIRNILRRAFK